MAQLFLPNFEAGVPTSVAQWIQQAVDTINGQLEPSANFRQYVESGTTTEDPIVVTHNLRKEMTDGSRPGAEFISWVFGPAYLYAVQEENWTEDEIILQSSAAGYKYVVVVR